MRRGLPEETRRSVNSRAIWVKATLYILLQGVLCGPSASCAQCLDALLNPANAVRSTVGAPSAYDDFIALVDGLYAQAPPDGATRIVMIGGVPYQVPPWFVHSDSCQLTVDGKQNLHSGFGVTTPSFDDYLVSGDELSELMIVTALARDHERMLAIHNTITTSISQSTWGLPCVTLRVHGQAITCAQADSATDVTARIALAYYYAANNPSFPCQERSVYLDKATTLARRHLDVEYVNLTPGQCRTSGSTGAALCHWVAGGGGSASGGLSGMEMWIGYHQDIVRMLIAACTATADASFLTRAQEVVDQWLVASEFSGSADSLSVGRKNFKWDTSSNPMVPKPGDAGEWTPGNPVWDDSDAPRAFWMGDALRALLISGAAMPSTLPASYAILQNWVEREQVAADQTPTGSLPPNQSCLQPYLDGTCAKNYGTDFYFNGLGTGLHTVVHTEELAQKLAEALSQYGWSGGGNWNNQQCFGIYRGIRPVKALASAIGLDSTTYGVGSCGMNYFTVPPCRVLDTRQHGGPLGAGEIRLIDVQGQCGIPKTARALSINLTIVQPSAGGHVSLGNDQCHLDETSAVNFAPGQTRANNAVLRLTRDGYQQLVAKVTIPTGGAQLLIDVTGYFE